METGTKPRSSPRGPRPGSGHAPLAPPAAFSGLPPPPWQDVEPRAGHPEGRGLATAALICGVVAAVCGLVPVLFLLAVPLGSAAVALGVVAARGRDPGTPGRRQAIAGAVTGALGIGLALLWLVGIAVVLSDEGFREQLQQQLERLQVQPPVEPFEPAQPGAEIRLTF